jgi:hypothetical protein
LHNKVTHSNGSEDPDQLEEVFLVIGELTDIETGWLGSEERVVKPTYSQ